MTDQPVTASAAQRRIFDAVVRFIAEHGYAPRPAQLQRFLQDTSMTMVWRHMKALEQNGALVLDGKAYRPNRRDLQHYSRGFGDAAEHFRARVHEALAEHGTPEATIAEILAVFDDEIPQEPSHDAQDEAEAPADPGA